MTFTEINQGRLKLADSLRATFLGMILRVVGDDILELADGAAPSEQRVDQAVWLTPAELADGLEAKIHQEVDAFQKRLAEFGVRGMVYLASDGALLDGRGKARVRLYGETERDQGTPDEA
jgi:hypothetical protein